MTSTVAVIMVGGPSTSNFRALGSVPAPLFPIAGRSLIDHPIRAAAALPGLKAVYVVGFYEERDFSLYLSGLSAAVSMPIRYLQESRGHGSAGGLHEFRATLMEEKPEAVFVLYCDVCCSFPLGGAVRCRAAARAVSRAPPRPDLLAAQLSHPGALGTMLVKRVPAAKASECGEVVEEAATHALLHYTERPETLVSDLVDTGVYVFSPSLFDVIASVLAAKPPSTEAGFVRMADVLTPFAGKQTLFVHETKDFWDFVKAPGHTLKASELYLEHFRATQPALLAPSRPEGPAVVGNCYVHASAKVALTAKLGPNVTVSTSCRVGDGARLINCILLDGAEVGDHAFVANAIIGWKSRLGTWSRVQGSGAGEAKNGVCILGEDVSVAAEVVVVNCIVLPHKEIRASVKDEVIL